MENSCDNPEDPTEYDLDEDVQHLMETLQHAESALDALWRVAGPLLQRSADRNTYQTCKWSYYQVFDGLRHSRGWLERMPQRASDGTSVWAEDPPPAVTNDVEEPDGLEAPETRGAVQRGARQERRAGDEDIGLEARGIVVTNGGTVARRETPREAKAREALAEERRLAKLRKPAPRSRKKSTRR